MDTRSIDTRSIAQTLRRVFSRKERFTIDLSKEDPSILRMWVVRAQRHILLKGKMGGLRYLPMQ